MKIFHREFEECAKNPAGWLNSKKLSAPGFITTGYDGYTKLAILTYHKTKSDIISQKALSKYLAKFKDVDRIDECEAMLASYIDWYQRSKPIVIATRRRMNIDINFGNSICGEVTRVDFTPKGYLGILLMPSKPISWRSELRMPLLQLGLSQLYDRQIDEFAIGIQLLDGSGLECISFSISQVNRALEKAELISKDLYNAETP